MYYACSAMTSRVFDECLLDWFSEIVKRSVESYLVEIIFSVKEFFI